VDDWLASLPPPHPEYRALQRAYVRYSRGGDSAPISAPKLKPGASHDAVPLLRERLADLGFTSVAGDSADVYDDSLAEAVRAFQTDRGLKPDGIIGAGTLKALNAKAGPSSADKAAILAANMERWRWVPRDLSDTRVEVNIAAQRMTYFEDGAPALDMKTVVGAPGDNKTPILYDEIETVVLNPPWTVPMSIVRKEFGGRARRGYKVLGRYNGLPVLQQPPGPNNSLGRVKFDMPNRWAIYLHDTPAKAAFSQEERALSHGCVRLERPIEFAETLLRHDPAWTPEAIAAAVETRKTTPVALSRAVPVYLLYWTASVDPQGKVNFHKDIYGWDAKLLSALQGQTA
jgi:murein L,D-transpeptidase YcbB/YkuD